MTQLKLTGFGIVQGPQTRTLPHSAAGEPGSSGTQEVVTPTVAVPAQLPPSSEEDNMEVLAPESTAATAQGPQTITTDFLLKALKDNKDDIVKSFNASISALALRVESNSVGVSNNAAGIDRNKDEISAQGKQLEELTSRVDALETCPTQ